MNVKAKIKCPKCKDEREYNSKDVEYDHLVCANCGAKIKVNKYIDKVDPNYINNKGTIMRKHPKDKMSKKERRRMRK